MRTAVVHAAAGSLPLTTLAVAPTDSATAVPAAALAPDVPGAAERDAATPYAGALGLHRRLAGSALVTERDTGTHGVAGGPNTCVNGHLEAYLLTGRIPGRRASCAPRPKPEPWAEPEPRPAA